MIDRLASIANRFAGGSIQMKRTAILGGAIVLSLGGCTLILGDVTATDAKPTTTSSDDVTSGFQTVAASVAASSAGSGGKGSGGAGGAGTGGNTSAGGGGGSTTSGGGSDGGPPPDPCFKQPSFQDCASCEMPKHPTGYMLLSDLETCIECTACYTICDGASAGCAMPPAVKSACDTGECGMCSNCAQMADCKTEATACSNNPDCLLLNMILMSCPPN